MECFVLNGQNLLISSIPKIAQNQVKLEFCPKSLGRPSETLKIVHNAQTKHFPVYGLTRNVGRFKNEDLKSDSFDQEVLSMHSTILGHENQDYYPLEVCKGAWTILANGFLNGGSFASLELLEEMRVWINDPDSGSGLKIEYNTSIGMADAIPLMQMAQNILPSKYKVKHGEGLALLSSNALTMSELCFSLRKIQKVLDLTEKSTALAILAENGNKSIILDQGFNASQWSEKQNVILKIRDLLENLESNQDSLHSHLSLRASCDILASTIEAQKYSTKILEEMMNSHQGNPYVCRQSGSIGSVANFDSTRLFNVFTYLQTAFGNLCLSLVRRGEYKVNEFGEANKQAMIQRYILWHLETCNRGAVLNAQAIPVSLARMAGAKGIEDWAPPTPELSQRIGKLIEFGYKIIVLESLLSAMVVHEKGIEVPTKLKEFYGVLIDHSPLELPIGQQYSMKSLFDTLSQKYK